MIIERGEEMEEDQEAVVEAIGKEKAEITLLSSRA